MEIVSFVEEGLGHSCHLVDLGDGRALVVDPPRLPEQLLHEANSRGLTINWTADSHSHADYVSGSPELRARGATFLASAGAGLVTPHHGLADGDKVDLGGRFTLQAIATPGHTPDHLAYLLLDRGTPTALFSGGSLMVGTVGRTDLLGPEPREELTRKLFRALRDRIMTLPDELRVYPTHGAGSFCSAPGASRRTTTIGDERATNPLVTIDDEDDFVAAVLDGLGSFPSYFRRLPEVNRRGPRLYGAAPDLPLLDLPEFRAAMDRGARIVDTRPIAAFARGHIPGALSNTLRPVFASWLGWLVPPDTPLVFVMDPGQDRAEVVLQALAIGHENLVGVLDGGIDTWARSGSPIATIALIGADGVTGTVIDVRQHSEFAAGHVPGAINIELGDLPDTDPPVGRLMVMCGHGERAMSAASILTSRGHTDLVVLDGGPDDWSRATGTSLETA